MKYRGWIAIAAACSMVVGTLVTVLIVSDHGGDIPTCSLTYFDPECSPSGWMAFILGDLVVAIALGVFLHHLGSKNDAKIYVTTKLINEILHRDEAAKKKILVFVSQSLKNSFNIILINAGLMNRALAKAKVYEDVPPTIRQNHQELSSILTRAHATIDMAVELYDPLFIEEMHKFLSKVANTKPAEGAGKGYPGYDEVRDDIRRFTEKIDSLIVDEDRVLK